MGAARDEGGAMRYLLTFVVEQRSIDDASPEEMKAGLEAWEAFDNEVVEAGVLIACEPLEPAATTIRVREGAEPLVTDGPFADTKEQLGGFCLLECQSLEEARAWADKVPMRAGSIEIRPAKDLSEFGYHSKTLTPAKATA
jgi:hypothetical protein